MCCIYVGDLRKNVEGIKTAAQILILNILVYFEKKEAYP
jgi:hypothetical protein